MFGYILVNPEELKVKEYQLYRSYYCGLCHELQKRYGRTAQMLLNYDMTFLAILRDALYEPEEKMFKEHCLRHPLAPHTRRTSVESTFAADMTIMLYYQKALDDWHDEHSHPKRVLAMKLHRDYKKLRSQYPQIAKVLESSVKELSEAESRGETNIDYVAGLTGRFLGEMFAGKEDIWKDDLYQLGFFLGKFVYLLDAYEDMEKDEKKGNYNLFVKLKEQTGENFEALAQSMLVDIAAQAARAYERMPVVKNAGILRNILYSGIWVKYAQVQKKRNGKTEQDMTNEKSL